MKQNLTNFFNLIKNDRQAKTLTIIGVLLLFIFTLGYSLSAFTGNKNSNAANIKVNDLSFNITTNSGESDDRILHLQAGKTEQFDIILTNLNKLDVKYELIYEVCNDSNCTSITKDKPSDLLVFKENDNTEISGIISTNKFKRITILTNNKSKNDYYIKLGLNAGYSWNELELANQINEVISLDKDIDIIAYVDGVEVQDLPSTCFYEATSTAYKNNVELTKSSVSFNCNYATSRWSYTIDNLSNIPDKLKVDFKRRGINAVEYITKLLALDTDNNNGLFIDPTSDKNIRYTGGNPRNYVEFGNDGELWRIVGIFSTTDSDGTKTKKLKLVRDKKLGNFSWDSRYDTKTKDYRGINDWNTASLMNELNVDYLNYNLVSNTNWYNNYWQDNKAYEKRTGVFNYNYTIKEKYQNYISKNVWNTGGNTYTNVNSVLTLPTLTQYNAERGSKLYVGDSSNNVTRTSTWTGKVGLIYASDFGYASNDKECRNDLRAGQVYDSSNGSYNYTSAKCQNDNWLFKNNTWYWTLSPYSDDANSIYRIRSDGVVIVNLAYVSESVFPSVYLKSDIKLTSGTGTSPNPYKLQ